jgi:hypothetical protein
MIFTNPKIWLQEVAKYKLYFISLKDTANVLWHQFCPLHDGLARRSPNENVDLRDLKNDNQLI